MNNDDIFTIDDSSESKTVSESCKCCEALGTKEAVQWLAEQDRKADERLARKKAKKDGLPKSVSGLI